MDLSDHSHLKRVETTFETTPLTISVNKRSKIYDLLNENNYIYIYKDLREREREECTDLQEVWLKLMRSKKIKVEKGE